MYNFFSIILVQNNQYQEQQQQWNSQYNIPSAQQWTVDSNEQPQTQMNQYLQSANDTLQPQSNNDYWTAQAQNEVRNFV